MSKIAYIPGISGAQQAAIADMLARDGWQIRGGGRGDDAAWRADPEIGSGLDHAMDGTALVVATIPQDHRAGVMRRVAGAVTDAAGRAGTRLIVNVGGRIAARAAGPLHDDLRWIRDRVLGGAAPALIVEPTSYLENLMLPEVRAGLAGGVLAYAAPPDVPIAWISHADLGRQVARLAAGGRAGESVRLGGPQSPTGPELAAAVGRGIGRALEYRAIPPAEFAKALNAAFGPPAGDRIASLYSAAAEEPGLMAGADPAVADAATDDPECFARRVLEPAVPG